MTTIHHLSNNHIAVEGLPDVEVQIVAHGVYSSLHYIDDKINFSKLPKGDWKILGWSDELTEEQCLHTLPTNTYDYIEPVARWYIAILGDYLQEIGCKSDRVLILKRI